MAGSIAEELPLRSVQVAVKCNDAFYGFFAQGREVSWLEIEDVFILTKEDRARIRSNFRLALTDGMCGAKSSLKCLPSFLPVPSGAEQGEWLALDFGGTNLRVMVVRLEAGKAEILRMKKVSLRRAGAYDYTDASTTAEELFDCIAQLILTIAPDRGQIALGHTFSFPARQITVDQARLIAWTKEFAVQNVIGQEVNGLLYDALVRCGAGHIKPTAIVNDTVATLLARAYGDPTVTIGSICGTGHNTAAVLPDGMVYNLESGNFDGLPVTEYDWELDLASLAPNTQRLEKMSAGRYLGELVLRAGLERLAVLQAGEPFTGEELGMILSDRGELRRTKLLVHRKFDADITQADCAFLRRLTRAVVARSAQMAAATYLGILDVIDPRHEREHTIAVDGSLFGKMPTYAKEMARTLAEGLDGERGRAELVWAGDGSGIGAAVAAALAEGRGSCR